MHHASKLAQLVAALWLLITPYLASAQVAPGAPIILVGTVLTPTGPIERGFVLIEQGRITSVTTTKPRLRNAVVLHTDGVIAPGFVDLHNHVSFNVLPRWNPSALFSDKYQWRADADYKQRVDTPYTHLVSTNFCDMNTWGELRALVGGTTSIVSTAASACIHGLVRNLDYNSGFYGTTELNLEHVFNTLELPPASNPQVRLGFAAQARALLASPAYDALILHLSEGTDELAHEEFAFMKAQSLLTSKGVAIHGLALTPTDFKDMAAAGTALVWSPRSNLELYGQTTDIRAAVAAGVEVALAPDWAITGSSNILDELRFAATWNDEQLGGVLSDRQLVDMVTAIPAAIAGVDDQVGTIRAGLRADLVVIKKHRCRNAYRAVIEARAQNVKLVFIDGVPLYGARGVMRRLWGKADLQAMPLPRGKKQLATPAVGSVVVGDVATRLKPALQAEGTSLAGLIEEQADTSDLDAADLDDDEDFGGD